MKIALGALAALIVLAAVTALPLPIRSYLDFQVIYHADQGLLRGIAVYDHEGQVDMIARAANVPADQVFVLPFPYPPWYALATLWLALLPIDAAARLWFGLNIIMVSIAMWLLTEGMRIIRRSLMIVLGIMFVPVLGTLFVGQYSFPVLLGAATMLHALRRRASLLTALGAVLLTFKPHLGGVILAISLAALLRRKDALARSAWTAVLAAGGILFAIGFFASPLWPLDYYQSLTGFRDVSQCRQCTSLPMALAGAAGGGFSQAGWVALVIGTALVIWLILKWTQLSQNPGAMLSVGVLLTLLVSPYLQNYDYVLLLGPLVQLAGSAQGSDWIWLGAAYGLPILGLGLFGTAGNIALVGSALILFLLAATKSANGRRSPAAD